jgi:hypothetical protein
MNVLFNACGIRDRDLRLAWVTETIGRVVESSKDLDKAEASAVIDRLESMMPTSDEQEPTFEDGAA